MTTTTKPRKPKAAAPILPVTGAENGERVTAQFPMAICPTDKHRIYVVAHALGVRPSEYMRSKILDLLRSDEIAIGPAGLAASEGILAGRVARSADR